MSDKRPVSTLPSLPQMLLRVLEAVGREQTDLAEIASVVSRDAAMAANILAVANAIPFARTGPCHTLERALLILGTDTVKAIVITAAAKQLFSSFGQQHHVFLKAFWRRSLLTAHYGHVLADLTGYQAPDQAYLAGLLSDLGCLILLKRHGHDYIAGWEAAAHDRALLVAEQELAGHAHPEHGAALIADWRIDPFVVDAVRYHHEDVELILDAHQLVKIVKLSSVLSAPDELDDQAIAEVDQLLGLNAALTRELRRRVSADVERLAEAMAIDIGDARRTEDVDFARQQLGQRVSELGQLSPLGRGIWQARSLQGLEEAARRVAYLMLDVDHCLLFRLDDSTQQLHGHLPRRLTDVQPSGLSLPLVAGRSIIVDALIDGSPTCRPTSSLPAVVDRQIAAALAADRLLCLPLLNQGNRVGVLVLAVDASFDPPVMLLTSVTSELAAALDRLTAATHSDAELDSDAWQHRVREAVHEAGNPLSIINNYLEMLRLRLGDEDQAQNDIQLIRQEIERVGEILVRLEEPKSPASVDGKLNLNDAVGEVSRLFERSIFSARGIQLQLRLDEPSPVVSSPSSIFRQVLTNLLKNAAEALPEGGTVTVTTAAGAKLNDRNFALVSVADNGPGISEPVLRQLFNPLISTKGGRHAGLGLSVTKRLLDEIGGTIFCQSGKLGTEFKVLVPV